MDDELLSQGEFWGIGVVLIGLWTAVFFIMTGVA